MSACPANPYALCVCGTTLDEHRPNDSGGVPGFDAHCLEGRFLPVAGADGDLECADAQLCDTCDLILCPEHDPDTATRCDGVWHHADCHAATCTPCHRADEGDRLYHEMREGN